MLVRFGTCCWISPFVSSLMPRLHTCCRLAKHYHAGSEALAIANVVFVMMNDHVFTFESTPNAGASSSGRALGFDPRVGHLGMIARS
jgi:hypothetical protein